MSPETIQINERRRNNRLGINLLSRRDFLTQRGLSILSKISLRPDVAITEANTSWLWRVFF